MDDAKAPLVLARGTLPRVLLGCVVLPLVFSLGAAGSVFSQPGPAPSSAPPQSESADTAKSGNFQTRIDAAAQALREGNPRFKGLSPKYVQGRAEFVSGNMLFVLFHEMAHVAITEMGLPVLGRMEDAADTFAALRLIRVGSDFSRRVLTDAAEGWFMADRRDRKMQDEVAYYDEHGLNQQRAYQIVCLMVGYDDQKFKDLAKETKLPQERQDTCAGDYSNVAYSWDLVLKPHRRALTSRRRKSKWSMARPRAGLRPLGRWRVPSGCWKRWPGVRQRTSRGRLPSHWKCRVAARLMPAGTLRPANSHCVTNWPAISQSFIAAMATCEWTARR